MDHQLIQQIYTAGISPARFEALLESWAGKILADDTLDGRAELERPEIIAHIRQAVAMFDDPDAGAAEEEADPWMGSPYPVMWCDVGGSIRRANLSARSRYGIAHVRDLPFDADTVDSVLRQVTRAAMQPAAASAIVPARHPVDDQAVFLSVQRERGSGLVRLMSNQLHWPVDIDNLLQSMFQLSAAECAVMRLLTEGASVAEVAEERASSVATVRAQVRSIYQKTDVRSQPELIRLAIGLVSLLDQAPAETPDDGADESAAAQHPTADERHILILADGRRLDYADFGNPRGRPLVFLHDEYYGDCWGHEVVRSAAARGLRIVSPARPYYGRSDGYPPGVEATRQFAADLEELLDHLGIGDFTILARRTGFRFAVEIAHRIPERVAGLVALSPALPARSADDYRHMTRLARFITLAIFRKSAIVELVCQAGIRYLRKMGPKRLARLLNQGCREDLAVLEDPALWRLLEAGMAFSAVNGYLGYLHDVRHDPARAWERAIRCPVPMHCVIGALDPHDRIRRAQRCIEAGAHLTVSTVAGAGQLFFLTHPMRVLDELRRLD